MTDYTSYPQSAEQYHHITDAPRSASPADAPERSLEALPATPPFIRRIGRLTLAVTRGPESDKTIELLGLAGASSQVLRGGQSPVGDIVLTDPQVAGAHFDLELDDAGVLLRDLDTPGGVSIGGVKIREARLSVGDSFVVGETELRLVSAESTDLALPMIDHFGELYGRSPAMRGLFRDLASLTGRGDRLGVLLCGEPGTGKELVARELHAASMRGRQPFAVFDAAGAPPELAASLLFGQTRGLLTNPGFDQRGALEAADGGTLYIKDIDALPPTVQLQLHRALQEGAVTRVGEQSPHPVEVRLIGSTRGDLRRRVAAGEFRPELYFHVAGATLVVPPLHTRDGDIELLAEHFLRRLAATEQQVRRFTSDAALALRSHRWPAHVASLRDAVERGFFATDGESISRADLDLGKRLDRGMIRRLVCFEQLFGIDHSEAVAGFEKLYFCHLLRTHPSKAKATRTSGMTHEGFRLALRRLKLVTPDLRPQRANLAMVR